MTSQPTLLPNDLDDILLDLLFEYAEKCLICGVQTKIEAKDEQD